MIRKFLWVLGLLFLVSCSQNRSEPLVYGSLPAFELVNQLGQPVKSNDYQGKIWVANFIFTSCAGTCPMLTQRMKKVQEAIEGMGAATELPLRIVSFSVDPERDTPEKLAQYAQSFHTNPKIWTFVTGPLDKVTQTVVKGFKISMGKVPVQPGQKLQPGEIFDVVHGEKFILIDEKGQIRGYYDSDPRGIQKLIADLKYLYKKIS